MNFLTFVQILNLFLALRFPSQISVRLCFVRLNHLVPALIVALHLVVLHFCKDPL